MRTGELTARYTPPPSFASPRGAVQGGLIAGFLDEVMGKALLAVTEAASVRPSSASRSIST